MTSFVLFLLLFFTNPLHLQTINTYFNCLKEDCNNDDNFSFKTLTNFDIHDIPFIFSNSSNQNSSSVSIKLLLKEISNQNNLNNDYGIIILETGNDDQVEWFATSHKQSKPLTGLSSLSQPKLQIAFQENLPLYHFDASNLEFYPEHLVIIESNSNISFRLLKVSDSIDCRGNALIFSIVLWDHNVQEHFKEFINFQNSKTCSICEQLNISRTWVRLCPFIIDSKNSPDITTDNLIDSDIDELSPSNSEPDVDNSIDNSFKYNFPKLRLTDDLRGLFVDCGFGDMSDFGFVECNTVFEDITELGVNPICEGSENGFLITFGRNATLQPGQVLQLQLCSPSISVWNFPKNFPKSTEDYLVSDPISPTYPSFVVDYPDEVMNCDSKVKIEIKQIQGNGDRDLIFEWDISDGDNPLAEILIEEKTRRLEFPGQFIDGNLTLSVRGCNYGGKCSEKKELHITVVQVPGVFRIHIIGFSPFVYPSSLIRLQALPEFSTCNVYNISPNNVEFWWYINDTLVSMEDNYRIPSNKYLLGSTLNISVTATFTETREQVYKATATEILTYTPEPLYLSMDSAASRELPVDQDLILDASSCRDYNSVDSILKHNWKCEIISNKSDNTKPCNIPNMSTLQWAQSILVISSFTLKAGESYKFTNNITSSNGLNGTLQTIVTITEAELPLITIQPMKEKEDVLSYIRVQAFVSSIASPINITWQVVQSNNSSWFELKHILNESTAVYDNLPSKSMAVSLIIPPKNLKKYPKWTGLKPSSEYIIRLLARNIRGPSYYDITVRTATSPRIGKIEIYPMHDIIALETPVKFEIGDGWDDLDSGKLLFRFGFTTIHVNHSHTIWMPQTSAKIVSLYLPSASPDPPACKDRIGCKVVLEACDEGTCRLAESDIFNVASSENSSLAVANIISLINVDIRNNNFFSALAKIYALLLEKCDENLKSVLADQTVQQLLKSLDSTSTSLEYREVLQAASSLLDYVSIDVVKNVVELMQTYRSFVGKLNSNPGSRRRRSVPIPLSSNKELDLEEVVSMLEMTDKIITKKDVPVAEVYFLVLNDFLSGFCVEIRGSSNRVIQASGKLYTTIQAQNIKANEADFLSNVYPIAGSDIEQIHFSEEFAEQYKQWNCGDYTTCNDICLATAKISINAAIVNKQIEDKLFSNGLGLKTLNKSVSDLYKIALMDPMNGLNLERQSGPHLYTIRIPINNHQASNYYKCFLITGDMTWVDTACNTTEYPIKIGGQYYQECTCSMTGLLGIFIIQPPIPKRIPPQSEIFFTFNMSQSNYISKQQLQNFLNNLQWETGLIKRLVNAKVISNSTNPVISMILRPPSKPGLQSNSYAVQAILKTVYSISGFKAYDQVYVEDSTHSVITRELKGDGNARKMMMYFTNSNTDVVGNRSEPLANAWTVNLAAALAVSELRFKNPVIFGNIFNFTITIPFSEEKTSLSAEEISLMIMEMVHYNEIDLRSVAGEKIDLNDLTAENIIELIVLTETNVLALVLTIVVGASVLLIMLLVGGAAIIKIRTERAIQRERQRIIVINPGDSIRPPAPQSAERINVSTIQNIRHR